MTKRVFGVSLFVIFVMLVNLLFVASLHSYKYAKNGQKLAESTEPYSQKGSRTGKKILILGDSAAYGTGASEPKKSFAGLLGNNCEDCSITNNARNGVKTVSVSKELEIVGEEKFDTAVIAVGANDILHFYVDLDESCKSFDRIAKLSSAKFRKTIVLTTPKASYSSFFIWPFNKLYGLRSDKLNDCIRSASSRYQNIELIDLEHIYSKKLHQKHESKDGLHMNDSGNEYWFNLIQEYI